MGRIRSEFFRYFPLYLLFILPTILLVVPAKTNTLFFGVVISIVVSGLVGYKKAVSKLNNKSVYIHPALLPIDSVIIIFLLHDFYLRWIVSSKVALLAKMTGLSADMFLTFVTGLLGVLAVHCIDEVLNYLFDKIEKIKLLNYKLVAGFLFIIILSVSEYLELQYSTAYPFSYLVKCSFVDALLNIAIIFSLNTIIWIIFSLVKSKILYRVFLVLFNSALLIWSVINYYVIEFHGSPLVFSEIRNLKTAMDVAGGYSYQITMPVAIIIVLFSFGDILISKINRNDAVLKSICIEVVIIGLSVPSCLRLMKTEMLELSWKNSIRHEGYLVYLGRDLLVGKTILRKPETYDPENLNYNVPEAVETQEPYPDIVVILNESFCDLDFYSSVNADYDYLSDFYNINNAFYGKAVAPNIGGGTNDSEFELLTSKSRTMLNYSAPFTYLESELLGRSIVEYVESLGYKSTAMHCGAATNYSRNRGYPAMGFDNIYLGPDAFENISYNGNRSWLDWDNYRDLINHYDENSSEPQFMYLLTFQNHGGWEKNKDELDTVHTQNDFSELTDDINEYLSSVKLTAEAFRELTDYYSAVNRNTIIVMVGDHSPSFIPRLKPNDKNKEIPDSISKRVVPYVVWTNFQIKTELLTEYTNMTDIIPVTLKAASIPLSAFYSTVVAVHQEYPVRLSNYYVKADNTIVHSEEVISDSILKDYDNLEYNSFQLGDEYRKELFLP